MTENKMKFAVSAEFEILALVLLRFKCLVDPIFKVLIAA